MKTALITGCNRGLGKQLLTDFAANGYNIIALVRCQNDEFDHYCNEIASDNNINITQFYSEFSSEESLTKAMDNIEAKDYNIDVLINNAGVNTNAKPIYYMDYKDVEDAFKVNYFAPFYITKRVAKSMIENHRGG